MKKTKKLTTENLKLKSYLRLGRELEIEQLGFGNGIRAVGLGTRGTKQRLERLKLIWESVCFVGFLFLFPFFGVDRIWVIPKPNLIISDKTRLIIFTHDIL